MTDRLLTPFPQPLPAVPAAPRLYFVNGAIDFLFIGGLSILAYFALAWIYGSNYPTWLGFVTGWLVFAVNYPHFAATNYRLYHSRDNVRQYPITALVVPWLLVLAVAGAFYSPAFVAPVLWKVFYLWSPFHFSGQSFGISLVYARRAGFFVGKWERFTLANTIYGVFLFAASRDDAAAGPQQLSVPPQYDVELFRLGLPEWMPYVLLAWAVLNATAFAVLVLRWCFTQRRVLPPIVLVPLAAQAFWFLPGWACPAFFLLVPAFHSLQYLYIAWSMQLKEKMDQNGIPPSKRYVLTETARWGAINLLVGAALFYAIPISLYRLLTSGFGLAYSELFVVGIVIIAVQIHHFFVDGVIWKLKRKTVSSPLMVNLDDLIREPLREAV